MLHIGYPSYDENFLFTVHYKLQQRLREAARVHDDAGAIRAIYDYIEDSAITTRSIPWMQQLRDVSNYVNTLYSAIGAQAVDYAQRILWIIAVETSDAFGNCANTLTPITFVPVANLDRSNLMKVYVLHQKRLPNEQIMYTCYDRSAFLRAVYTSIKGAVARMPTGELIPASDMSVLRSSDKVMIVYDRAQSVFLEQKAYRVKPIREEITETVRTSVKRKEPAS